MMLLIKLIDEKAGERWEVAVACSEMGFQYVSFVNSVALIKVHALLGTCRNSHNYLSGNSLIESLNSSNRLGDICCSSKIS